MVLVRFDEYWGGWEGNHFDTAIYRLVPEHASQRLLLEQGIAHASNTRDGLPLEALTELEQSGNLEIYATAGENVDMIGINTATGPCSDPKVRQAISYAMDYQGVSDSLYFGRATVAKGPVPPTYWGFDDSANSYRYDLARVRELLDDAGYADDLVLNAVTDENALRQREMQALASALDEVGVTVNIVTMTWPTLYATLTNLDTAPDLYSFTWYADYADPDDVIFPLFHSSQVGDGGFNLGWYANPAVDVLLERAQRETDKDQRIGTYAEIQRILVDDAAAIWIVNPDAVFAISSSIEGFVYTPFWSYGIYNMYMKP
jgi:peptide/nickel transport system substrate-binding protein